MFSLTVPPFIDSLFAYLFMGEELKQPDLASISRNMLAFHTELYTAHRITVYEKFDQETVNFQHYSMCIVIQNFTVNTMISLAPMRNEHKQRQSLSDQF